MFITHEKSSPLNTSSASLSSVLNLFSDLSFYREGILLNRDATVLLSLRLAFLPMSGVDEGELMEPSLKTRPKLPRIYVCDAIPAAEAPLKGVL